MGISSIQLAEDDAENADLPMPANGSPAIDEEVWKASGAADYAISFQRFGQILMKAGEKKNYGLPSGEIASPKQRSLFLGRLTVADLMLARACAEGNEAAWKRFYALYSGPLRQYSIFITGSKTLGIELADALPAELYGLGSRDGARYSPLAAYWGLSSLKAWLFYTLRNRIVDHHRLNHPVIGLGDHDVPAPEPEAMRAPSEISILNGAITRAIQNCLPEERFLLAAHFLDERKPAQIGQLLGLKEWTTRRKLKTLTDKIRKQVLINLRASNLGRREAAEALGTDPRDLEVNVTKLLRELPPGDFSEEVDG